MRIITGTAKGTRLDTLDGDSTRPTGEKVKEAVFSMIQFDIEGRRVLDVFGGSGQMALEALSRGAESAVILDNNIDAVNIIKRNAQKTHLYEKTRVLCSDYAQAIRSLAGRGTFHLIFVDPPYAEKLVPDVLKKLYNAGIIAPGGLIVAESDEETPFEMEGLTIRRHNRYGRVYITLYAREDAEETAE